MAPCVLLPFGATKHRGLQTAGIRTYSDWSVKQEYRDGLLRLGREVPIFLHIGAMAVGPESWTVKYFCLILGTRCRATQWSRSLPIGDWELAISPPGRPIYGNDELTFDLPGARLPADG